MVTLSPDEFKALTPDEQREHLRKEEIQVFGVGFQRDKHGRPIEQGIGAPGRETDNHRAGSAAEAYRKRLAAEQPG